MNHTEPGKYTIERFFAGELDTESAREVKEHLNVCKMCSAYVQSLEHDRREFLAGHSYNQWAKSSIRVMQLPWYQRLGAWLFRPSLIPVYGVVLVMCIVLPAVLMRDHGADVGFKGGSGLSFVCERDGKVRDGVISEHYQAGDKIQILYSYEKRHHAGLLSVDSKGTVSMYHPDRKAPVVTVVQERGTSLVFPGSIILDDTPGEELIIMIIAEHPIATRDVQQWAKALFSASGNLGEMETHVSMQKLPKVTEVRTLLLKKR